MWRFSHGIAPSWMLSIRSPITSCAPSSSSFDEARDLGEVVGEVGVGHHDVVAARGGEAGEVGAAVAPARLVDDASRRRRARARRCRRSEPLSTTITSPEMPFASSAVPGRAHALLDVLRLVQARDHDRDPWHELRQCAGGEGRLGHREKCIGACAESHYPESTTSSIERETPTVSGRECSTVNRRRRAGRLLPREARGAHKPGGDQSRGLVGVAKQQLDCLRDRLRLLGVEEPRSSAGHLCEGTTIRAGNGHSTRHSLQHGQPEALVQ